MRSVPDPTRTARRSCQAVGPGNARFISILQLLSDAHAAARHVRAVPCCMPAAAAAAAASVLLLLLLLMH